MYRQFIPVSEFRKMKVKPEKSLQALKKDLDKVFNAYIRKRDTLPNGLFRCITCREFKPVRLMHAGHYLSAGHNPAVRWNEFNVNGQCSHCNTFLHGNISKYIDGMREKYGLKVLEDLEIQRHNRSKMMKFEVQLLIETYKEKLKRL